MQPDEVPAVTAAELSGSEFLLDVREPNEWEVGHAVGATHLPMGEVPDRYAELPAGRDAVIVCRVGGRSAKVTAWLLDQGYQCRNLTGGMLAYAGQGLPMASESGQEPTVL